jgi:hypothetical protein
MLTALSYAFPLLPVLARLAIITRFPLVRCDILNEVEQDRETYRIHILPFIGFSVTALSALAVVEATLRTGLYWAIYYLVISFFAYALALNWVGYKAKRWEDQLVTGVMEVGMLSLFSAVVAILVATQIPTAPIIAVVGIIIWGIDHGRRISLDWGNCSRLAALKEHANDS